MSYYSQEDYEDMELVMESDEAVWRPRRRPTPPYNANRRPYAPQPHRPGPAQHAQVSQGFEKVGNDVRQLVTQVKELETRVDASNVRSTRVMRSIHADLQQTKMISALLPMLSRPDTVKVEGPVEGIPGLAKDDKIAKAKDDTMALVLPLMLMTGMGSADPFANGNGDGAAAGAANNNNMMMMLVLAIALSDRNKK